MSQPVTGTKGNIQIAYNTSHKDLISSPRLDACAVAGTSMDNSSFCSNLFAGSNCTATSVDIWALSLPKYLYYVYYLLTEYFFFKERLNCSTSAVWIAMNTSGGDNTPRAGSSCNRVNSYYAVIAGGCYGAPGRCFLYGRNSLVQDPNLGGFNWQIPPTDYVYFVPATISRAIDRG